jgi:hypothetical protein
MKKLTTLLTAALFALTLAVPVSAAPAAGDDLAIVPATQATKAPKANKSHKHKKVKKAKHKRVRTHKHRR